MLWLVAECYENLDENGIYNTFNPNESIQIGKFYKEFYIILTNLNPYYRIVLIFSILVSFLNKGKLLGISIERIQLAMVTGIK